jgi:hypothetical protein
MSNNKNSALGPQSKATAELTIFRKVNGPLSKRISLSADCKIKSDGSECRMAEGAAGRLEVSGVDELAEIVGHLYSDEALALGRLRDDLPNDVRVVPKSKLNGQAGTG